MAYSTGLLNTVQMNAKYKLHRKARKSNKVTNGKIYRTAKTAAIIWISVRIGYVTVIYYLSIKIIQESFGTLLNRCFLILKQILSLICEFS